MEAKHFSASKLQVYKGEFLDIKYILTPIEGQTKEVPKPLQKQNWV